MDVVLGMVDGDLGLLTIPAKHLADFRERARCSTTGWMDEIKHTYIEGGRVEVAVVISGVFIRI